MSLSSTLKLITSVPPRIAFKKALRKISTSFTLPLERRRILSETTYRRGLTLERKLRWFITPFSENEKELLRLTYADAYRSAIDFCFHRTFDILGSGLQHWTHTADARGLGEFQYSTTPLICEPEPTGQWLLPIINEANVSESIRLYSLISEMFPSIGIYTPIDWQRDMKSGYSWSEGAWHKDITTIHTHGVDPKVPWEIGRMHHLVQCAIAYTIEPKASRKTEILSYVQATILDFIATNPPGFGIQWTTTMDVAIRIVNMIIAINTMHADGATFEPVFLDIVSDSIIEHCYHIRENLEYSDGMRGNHYLSNICGLLIASLSFDGDISELKEWKEFSKQEFIKEVLYQFNEDGGNFEASTSYHYFSTEMILWTLAMLKNRDEEFTDISIDVLTQFTQRLLAITSFSTTITNNSGLYPMIGDVDSGRFVQAEPLSYFEDVCLPILDCLKIYHGNSCDVTTPSGMLYAKMMAQYDATKKQSLNDMNKTFVDITAKINTIASHSRESYHHSNFGIAIQRWNHAQSSVMITLRAGSVGQNGKGGHAHNDALSLWLCINNLPIIVDTGTYLYTPLPEVRNQFRSVSSHSTITLNHPDGTMLEPNTIESGKEQLFWMRDTANATITTCTDTLLVASHSGYDTDCIRCISSSDSIITIEDTIALRMDNFHIASQFILHPKAVITRTDEGVYISFESTTIRLTSNSASLQIAPAEYSSVYGKVEPTSKIIFTWLNDCCTTTLEIIE